MSTESPSPEKIKRAREKAGLTQTQAAALIHARQRSWQDYELGRRKLHPGLWELFNNKINNLNTV